MAHGIQGDLSTCPCKWCGEQTNYTGTRECDYCHNMSGGIERKPKIALKMLLHFIGVSKLKEFVDEQPGSEQSKSDGRQGGL